MKESAYLRGPVRSGVMSHSVTVGTRLHLCGAGVIGVVGGLEGWSGRKLAWNGFGG